MLIKRRHFIRSGSLATAGTLLVPKFLQALGMNPGSAPLPPGIKTLIVIQLSGGNDGLNTVIPVRNDIYYKERPRLAIKKDAALAIGDEAGLHPALSAFRELYDQGSLAILNNVGYPNPDRSHFRSMDIWHTASNASDYWNTGWLGRYLDAKCSGCENATQILELDDILSLALKGSMEKGIATKDPARLYNTSKAPVFEQLAAAHRYQEEPVADYLYKTLASTIQSADYIFAASKQKATKSAYPDTELGKSLKTISSLVQSDINTRVYYVSLGSFDTHINQDAQQSRLFRELNDAVNAFVKDMKAANRFSDTMLMTFSEFGRRVSQNASAGTDHGTANNMIFVSGGLRKQGLINDMPNLSDLDNGDLKFTTDFRQVYATLLDRWLDTPHKNILQQSFNPLDFV